MNKTLALCAILALILCVFTAPLLANPTFPGQEEEEIVETVGPEVVQEAQKPDGVNYVQALLMVENNCKLRNQFKGTRAFLELDSGFYPALTTKLVSGKPRIKFYQLQADVNKAVIDPSEMTSAQMIEMLTNLQNNPAHYDPEGVVTEVMISRETTTEDLVALLERFGMQRGMTFDLAKKVTLLENGEDIPGAKQFDHDEELRKLNPDHKAAAPPADYDYQKHIDERDRVMTETTNKKTEAYLAKKGVSSMDELKQQLQQKDGVAVAGAKDEL